MALQKAVKVLGEGIAEAPAGPASSGDAGAIRALVDAVSKQSTAVKIELGPRIKVQACKRARCPFSSHCTAQGNHSGEAAHFLLPLS